MSLQKKRRRVLATSGGMRCPSSSEPVCNRIAVEIIVNRPRQLERRRSPMAEISSLNKLKRKRPDEDVSENSQLEKRQRKEMSPADVQETSGIDDSEAVLAEQQLRHEQRKSAEAEIATDKPSYTANIMTGASKLRAAGPEAMIAAATTSGSASVKRAHDSMNSDPTSLTPLQRTIESQFSLEILLKHKELRLIEQELAKCQVAYEQLRRCELIPYPGTAGLHPMTEDSSYGIASVTQNDPTVGPYAPPPGVTDGPYTRHYARWLIPDPIFDGPKAAEEPQPISPSMKQSVAEGRTTRNSVIEAGKNAGKGRSRGVASVSKKQSPANIQSTSRDKHGPLIVKRSSDGQFVKLVCLDCERGDFSSTQGFINHCRIAHHRGFESHDAAANACGQPVELDENGGVLGDSDGRPAGLASLVHPLIRSAPPGRRQTGLPSLSSLKNALPSESQPAPASVKDKPASKPRAKTRARTLPKDQQAHELFNASSQTPHLSALVQRAGLGINLGDMVTEAQQRFDFGIESSDEDESSEAAPGPNDRGGAKDHRQPLRADGHTDDHGESTESPATARRAGARVPAQSVVARSHRNRPSSNKGPNDHGRILGQSRVISASTPTVFTSNLQVGRINRQSNDSSDRLPNSPTSPDLSPTTIELTTAPSLISDDDEYEAYSESESPSSLAAEEADEDMDFEIEDGNDTAGPRGSELSNINAGVKPSASRPALSRRRRVNRSAAPRRRESLVGNVVGSLIQAGNSQGQGRRTAAESRAGIANGTRRRVGGR